MVKKSPEKGKKQLPQAGKQERRRAAPIPPRGPRARAGAWGRRGGLQGWQAQAQRKKRTADPKPRLGKVDAEFTGVKDIEFMRAAIAAVDATSAMEDQEPARGHSNIDPRALVKCILLMIEEKKMLRYMVAHLHAHPDAFKAVGLEKAPSKSTLNRAMRRIP